MAGIDKPPKAPKGHWPDKDAPLVKGKPWFRSVDQRITEDLNRASGLEEAIELFPDSVDVPAAHDLIARLRHGANAGNPAQTLASQLFMRGPQHALIGHAWRLQDQLSPDLFSTLDLRPKKFVMTAEELMAFEPEQLLNPIRMDFLRCGASKAKGGLCLALHGQFNRAAGMFDLHAHGFVTHEMKDVADEVRHLRKYAEPHVPRGVGLKQPSARVILSRKPLINPAYRLSYIWQDWWPDRIDGVIGNVAIIRGVKRRRIPEPYHSMLLLWLDRRSLSDMTLMMGLRMTASGFKLTKI